VIQDVVEWCGGAITLREARRFRQLVNIPQWRTRLRCAILSDAFPRLLPLVIGQTPLSG
jgi:hypothetical protein